MKTVIEMAKEASAWLDVSTKPEKHMDFLKRFAELVRADEREACAKVCDDAADNVGPTEFDIGASLAAAIRARGNA